MLTRPVTQTIGLVLLCTALAIIGAAPIEAAILPVTVCNDNGAQLRSLINAGTAGDTITLPAGCTIT